MELKYRVGIFFWAALAIVLGVLVPFAAYGDAPKNAMKATLKKQWPGHAFFTEQEWNLKVKRSTNA